MRYLQDEDTTVSVDATDVEGSDDDFVDTEGVDTTDGSTEELVDTEGEDEEAAADDGEVLPVVFADVSETTNDDFMWFKLIN